MSHGNMRILVFPQYLFGLHSKTQSSNHDIYMYTVYLLIMLKDLSYKLYSPRLTVVLRVS